MTAPIDRLPPDTPPASAGLAQTRSRADSTPAAPLTGGAGIEELDYRLSPRLIRGADCGSYERASDDPIYRPLQVYALDPSASVLIGAVATVNVPYEPLEPGPAGKVFRVVDDGFGSEMPTPALRLDEKKVLL